MLTYLSLAGPNLESLICLGMICLWFKRFFLNQMFVAKLWIGNAKLLTSWDCVCHLATLAQ